MRDERKRLIIMLLIPVCFILMIVAIFSVVSYQAKSEIKIAFINEGSLKANNQQVALDDGDMRSIGNMLKHFYSGSDNPVRVGVREGTYTEVKQEWGDTEISFLMDVDAMNTTYSVFIVHGSDKAPDMSLSCVAQKYSKFPESYCLGSDSDSSIRVNMDDALPYNGVDELGREFRLNYVSGNSNAALKITLFSRCDDDGAADAAMRISKDYIRSYGMDPEQVPLSIDKSVCWAE